MIERVVIAYRDQHVTSTYAQSATVNRVPLQQLEMLRHLLLCEGEFLSICSLGDGKDQKEHCGKGDSGYCRDRLREEIHQRSGQ